MNYKPLKGMILAELLTRQGNHITRNQLQKKMWAHYSSHKELDEVMQQFIDAEMIERHDTGLDVTYVMPYNQVTELLTFMSTKKEK